jgi:two-component system, OmpR family, sensor histidine kinase VicK
VLYYLTISDEIPPKEKERTEMIFDMKYAVSYGISFLNNTKERMDVLIDESGPSLIIKYDAYKDKYVKLLNRGAKIRFITEITKDNIQYCKELSNIVSELRHLDGLKGSISVNESEFIGSTTWREEQLLNPVTYSNEKEVVEQQQYIFDTFWKNAIPFEQRKREIEEGIVPEVIETSNDHKDFQNRVFSLLNSANNEILVLFSTSNAFHRQANAGSLQKIKEIRDIKPWISIKILTPKDIEIEKIADELANSNFSIRFIEPLSKVSILIIDRKYSLVAEVKDDTKELFIDAVGFVTYSNSTPTVLSYAAIFDGLWSYIDLSKQFTHVNKKLERQEADLKNQIDQKTQYLLKINKNLEKLNQEYATKEKELNMANKSLLETDRFKNEFISMISHELRTPLVPIKGYTQMLLKTEKFGELNEKQKKAIKAIYRNVIKQELLVEDILDCTKLEIGKLNLSKKEITISNLFANIINDSKSIAEEKQVSIVAEIKTKSTTNTIYCDEKRIEQVFLNLIKNSIDFVPEKGGQIILSVEDEKQLEEEDKEEEEDNKTTRYKIFTVKDNGRGIPRDKVGNLFKKFYQIDTSATRKHSGTGLGLVICKGIVETHGGKIWVDKNHKNGLSIKFTLPLSISQNNSIIKKP